MNVSKYVLLVGLCLCACLAPRVITAQITDKQINTQSQSWLSVNSTQRISNKWGIVADLHYRANHLFTDPNFYFARIGANYWLKDNITITLGYAHLWLAPTKTGNHTYANENRLYQQVQMTSKIGKINVTQRLRNEQRWQEKIDAKGDTSLHTNKFTNRVRYLLSYTIPIFKNPHYPSLVLADELCIQFGKEVLINTFEQNRVFVGIRQPINKHLGFDLGYMLLYQEKASTTKTVVYDNNHTFRWFFYYTPDFRSKKKV